MSDQMDAFTVSGLNHDRYDAFVLGYDAGRDDKSAIVARQEVSISETTAGKIAALNDDVQKLQSDILCLRKEIEEKDKIISHFSENSLLYTKFVLGRVGVP